MPQLIVLEKQELENMIKKIIIENHNLKNHNSLHNEIQIVGIKDVSELSGLTERTIRWKVSKNTIPCFQRGKPLLFSKKDILSWINNGRKSIF